MQLAPILLFTYNRLQHTQLTIEALQKNELADRSELFIYSDAPKDEQSTKNVADVRKYIQEIDGFKKITIIERDKNWGLANSIIDGVTTIVNQFGRVIVLEDDLVTSPYFLRFMNDSLEMYQKEKNIACIHGYIYPIEGLPETFFIRGADCWGWATWSDRWSIFEPDGKKLLDQLKRQKLENDADFNKSANYTLMLKNQILGKNNSWAVRWYMSAFLKDMLCLYPGKSYVKNIGHDSNGTHCKTETDVFNVNLNKKLSLHKIDAIEDTKSRIKMEVFFNSIKSTILQRIKSKIISLIT